MYSQDPEVRRRRVKLRFFAYGLMTVATIVFGVASLLYILGYRVDDSFEVERGGLLKFDSRPQGARVSLDNRDIDATPHQQNIAAGEYMVSYSKEGYQGWQKTVSLRPGEVLWLNYARLVPNSVTTSALEEFSSMHQTSASPNREWYFMHNTIAAPEFTLVDLRNEGDIKTEKIAIPEGVFTASKEKKQSFTILGWAHDSRYVLVQHSFGKAVEFIRVPRDNPEESINLNKLLSLPLASATFAANNPNIFFAKDEDDTLYKLDINNEDNPIKIAQSVSAYDDLSSSEVAFIGPATQAEDRTAKNQALYIWRDNNRPSKELGTIPAGVKAYVSYNPYLAHDYVSLVFQNSISVIQDPLSNAKTIANDTMTISADSLSASPGHRFFIAQRKERVYVYDVELARSYSFMVPEQKTYPMQWVDDHHLVMNGGNNLRLIEFDGTNTQQVTSVAGPYKTIIGADGEVMLSIGKNTTTKQFELQQSFLLTEADRNSFFRN